MTSLKLRTLDINLLMVIAVAGAAPPIGSGRDGGLVVRPGAVARSPQHGARAPRHPRADDDRAERGDGAARSADVQVPSQTRIGDVVVAARRAPAGDGVSRSGDSAVNQAPVTGESWPAEKSRGDSVFAGTINGNGALEVEARRPASDSTLARIIHLVEHAQSRRAPVQTFMDRFARRYMPAVVILAVAVAVVPPLVLGGVSGWTSLFGVWGYRALALLVVACPCALVISTPVSIVSALTAAPCGVPSRGAHLERLGSIRVIAFDKTAPDARRGDGDRHRRR